MLKILQGVFNATMTLLGVAVMVLMLGQRENEMLFQVSSFSGIAGLVVCAALVLFNDIK